jgi:hypothetical protein
MDDIMPTSPEMDKADARDEEPLIEVGAPVDHPFGKVWDEEAQRLGPGAERIHARAGIAHYHHNLTQCPERASFYAAAREESPIAVRAMSVADFPDMQAWNRGDWMQTYSGRRFYPMNPSRSTRSRPRHRPRAVAAVSLRRPRRPVLLGRRALRPHVERRRAGARPGGAAA